jgi:hypothetical protein
MHFERGGDHERALAYHQLAGSAALERHAAHEAAGHFGAALEALAQQPAVADRAERELALVLSRATLFMTTRGYAAPETEQDFTRARSLCDALPESPKVLPVLRGLLSYRQVRAELDAAHDLGELLLRHAPGDRNLAVQAHYGHGGPCSTWGRSTRAHLEHALAEYDPAMHGEHMRVYGGYDPGVACSMWLGWTLSLLGRLEEAAIREREGVELARRLAHPFSLAWAYCATGAFKMMFGDYVDPRPPPSRRSACRGARLPVRARDGNGEPGMAVIMQGNPAAGIPILREGVAAVDATGAALVRPQYLGMLGGRRRDRGPFRRAAARVDEALAEMERVPVSACTGPAPDREEPPLVPKDERVEACLRRALDVARLQGARMLEPGPRSSSRVTGGSAATSPRARTARRSPRLSANGPRAIPDIAAARRLLAELGPSS